MKKNNPSLRGDLESSKHSQKKHSDSRKSHDSRKSNESKDSHKFHESTDFFIFGKQPCVFVVENHSDLIKEIYFGKDIDRAIFTRFSRLNKPIIRADAKKMQSLAKGGNHQGFILRVAEPKSDITHIKNLRDFSKIVVLVGLSDVGNIGAIFRTCLAFGVECVISTTALNLSGVARSSSGAFFSVPHIIYKDYLSLANELKMAHFSLLGADMSGANLGADFNAPTKWALFLGSEGEGIPKKLLARMDLVLGIKMQNSVSLKGLDSLNVSVAAGILLHNLARIK